ncbi:MAG TPA: TIGR04438 family Trp-rich protein [Burkholderiaceae bacterium]|nr:TIGR04438 family Trp-rich protein [Burkholderiaceae bacterium]HQR69020.1 TIGR04438 family Trp-rich protein [Burkholderiaceae bacterium]
MWILWIGVALVILKLLEISVFANLSWWWISAVFAVALFWFEVVERRLGLDKKKAFDEMEAHKKRRIQQALEANKARKR